MMMSSYKTNTLCAKPVTPVHSAMLQRKCACGGSSGLTGSCPDCEKRKFLGRPLQAKLRLNEPDDAYEQEADRVAAHVMQRPEATFGSSGPQSLQRAEAASEPPVTESSPQGEGPSHQEEGSRCPSWFKDPESLSKRAAENYVQNDMTPPSTANVDRIDCEPPNSLGNYRCFVHFSDGLVIEVIVRAKDVVVGVPPFTTMTPPPATPLCFYDYDCPEGLLVLTKRECKSAKPAAPAGPPLVAQRRAAPGTSGAMEAPQIVHDVLAKPGQPLDPATRQLFSTRFGNDFANVRVHADTEAADSARSVNALAYTVGRHVVFGTGQYAPSTREGHLLLAHELTHVVQQGEAGATLQRASDEDTVQQPDNDATHVGKWFKHVLSWPIRTVEKAEEAAERAAEARLKHLGNKPSTRASLYTHAYCPPTFCQPFNNRRSALAELAWAGPLILAGIAKNIGSAVVPIWTKYMAGGSSSPENLSHRFGAEFTQAGTTRSTTQYLMSVLRQDIELNQDSLIGASAIEVDFTSRLSRAIGEIDTPNGLREMAFVADIPGNLAGAIGKDQVANPIGHRPSPQDDSREARISATLVRNQDGGITVTPTIKFTVKDTVDLCPGHCGGLPEQVATIPLSRFEATGLMGDVPFIVEFDAPAAQQVPFNIAAKKPVNRK